MVDWVSAGVNTLTPVTSESAAAVMLVWKSNKAPVKSPFCVKAWAVGSENLKSVPDTNDEVSEYILMGKLKRKVFTSMPVTPLVAEFQAIVALGVELPLSKANVTMLSSAPVLSKSIVQLDAFVWPSVRVPETVVASMVSK